MCALPPVSFGSLARAPGLGASVGFGRVHPRTGPCPCPQPPRLLREPPRVELGREGQRLGGSGAGAEPWGEPGEGTGLSPQRGDGGREPEDWEQPSPPGTPSRVSVLGLSGVSREAERRMERLWLSCPWASDRPLPLLEARTGAALPSAGPSSAAPRGHGCPSVPTWGLTTFGSAACARGVCVLPWAGPSQALPRARPPFFPAHWWERRGGFLALRFPSLVCCFVLFFHFYSIYVNF